MLVLFSQKTNKRMKISKTTTTLFLLLAATTLSRILSFAPAYILSAQPGFRQNRNFAWKELLGSNVKANPFVYVPKLQIYEPNNDHLSESYSWPNLLDDAKEMTLASFSQYPITFLRREAQAGLLKKSENMLDLLGNKSVNVCFSEMHDVVLENLEQLKKKFTDIVQWISCFKEIGERSALKVIDHQFEEKRAAYGINVNKNRKRVVIVFRGTINDGIMDWTRNFQFAMAKMKTPSSLKQVNEDLPAFLHVHQGYYEYLFNNTHRGAIVGEESYEELSRELDTILRENPGYKVYFTGHSLGGALATLAAFKMASSSKNNIPKPIICVSIGSPFVGDSAFRDAFQELEKKGWIRKLRITNSGMMTGDPIPCIWPVSLCGKMYKHVGMNLQLFRGKRKCEINYPSSKENSLEDILRGTRNFFQAISLDPNQMHTFQEYMKRLGLTASSLQLQKLETLYREKNIIEKPTNFSFSPNHSCTYDRRAKLSYTSLCSEKFSKQCFDVCMPSRSTVLRHVSREDYSIR